MKRCIATFLGLTAVGLLMAQAPFTIVRPADGSKVREKVHITVPNKSVPPGGYVGVFVGGKFVEATVLNAVPTPKDKFLEYVLDTKGRGLPDGKVSVELVLYVNARVADRSAVEVNIVNSTSIPVPEDGLKLRYKFRTGTELTYKLEQRVGLSTLTEAQNKSGGKPGELPMDAMSGRLLYAVDNVFGNGDALLRLQCLPEKGKDYMWLQADNDTEPRKYMDFDMHSVYQRVTGTGWEVFGSVPAFWPIDGLSGEGNTTDLFAVIPLPTLPTNPVKVGESWPARFQDGALDLANLYEQRKLTKQQPARGEFLGVEWESGYPCAKIRHTLELGAKTGEGKRLASTGASFSDEKTSIEEIFWFALDRGVVVKVVRSTTLDRRIAVTSGGNTGGGPAGGPGQAGAPGGGGPGPMGAGAAGGGGNLGVGEYKAPPGSGGGGGGGDNIGGRGGGRTGGGMMGPAAGGAPGGAGSARGGGGGTAASIRYVRLKIQEILTLE